MLSNDTRVPELMSSLSEFDILAPQRYSDQWLGTSGLQPEKSLMLAVLLDAAECFQKYALLRDECKGRFDWKQSAMQVFKQGISALRKSYSES